MAALTFAVTIRLAAAPKPLRILLLTGGCCHDYAKQKDILKAGLEERANVVVDQIHTDDPSTKPPLAILGNPDYANGYDLVIHDECGADISDPETVRGVRRIGPPSTRNITTTSTFSTRQVRWRMESRFSNETETQKRMILWWFGRICTDRKKPAFSARPSGTTTRPFRTRVIWIS
jgi:hypothetical protein